MCGRYSRFPMLSPQDNISPILQHGLQADKPYPRLHRVHGALTEKYFALFGISAKGGASGGETLRDNRAGGGHMFIVLPLNLKLLL